MGLTAFRLVWPQTNLHNKINITISSVKNGLHIVFFKVVKEIQYGSMYADKKHINFVF